MSPLQRSAAARLRVSAHSNSTRLARTGAVSVSLIAAVLGPGCTSAHDPLAERLAEMTVEEKVGQLNQYSRPFDVTGPPPREGLAADTYAEVKRGAVGSVLNVTGAEATAAMQKLAVENSRLGIPLLFGYDVIHGYRTMFPIPLGEAASWDLAAIERSARIAATEAAAAGVHWTFAPMVDITRDARWGRVMEGAGEDPYLAGQIAAARVRGFQGTDLGSTDTVAACAKHYAAYGFAEGGRDYNTVDLSLATLHNAVLPPFQAAVEANVATLMTSFNEIGGVPSTGNDYLLRQVLKGQWGFRGFVVSDWGAIGEMVALGYRPDLEAASHTAFAAGTDMDMESRGYTQHLADLVERGDISVAKLDDAVRRVLEVKQALGLFDDPYRYADAARERDTLLHPDHLEAARDVARRSMVLLKNDARALPLDGNLSSLAVIGPLAADKDAALGSWRARAEPHSAVSVLEGLRAALGSDVAVTYAQGVALARGERSFLYELEFETDDRSGISAAVEAARTAEAAVVVLGEDAFQTGEGRSQVDLSLKGLQLELLEAVRAVNARVVVVLMNGRPLELGPVAAQADAILEAWHAGSQAGHAVADVLRGKYNPSGKLPISFPHHVGQLPLYYNHKPTGRDAPAPQGKVFWSHYTDAPNEALYPFGHGLSYTTFEYSALQLSGEHISSAETLAVEVTVSNTGSRMGTDVVQLYIHDEAASYTRPVLELKAFERVELAAGESRRVRFELQAADLAFYTASGKWAAEPGWFEVSVGGDSVNLLRARFELRRSEKE